MFWVVVLFIAMVTGLGNALSNPPVRDEIALFELIANLFVMYLVVGVPTLAVPFMLMFLRRRMAAGWRRLLA